MQRSRRGAGLSALHVTWAGDAPVALLPSLTCAACRWAAGSAISSIDPVATLAVLADVEVPPILYNLIFGESVLNE